MNTRTLISTFNDYSTARQAARELENNGVPADAIHIDSNRKTAGAGSSGYQNEEQNQSGFMGWWNSFFGSDRDDEERRGYEGALASGSTILRATVLAESVDPAVDVLNRYGAVDVDRRSGSDTARTVGRGPIEVVEEELQVGKRAIRRGGVRVYSVVVTQPVAEQVVLREEHVNVERRPVNREISPQEVSSLRDQTIEVPEMAEEPVIGKRARVREEVVVGKESTERTETVHDNVRRTEVKVEPLGRESQPSGASEPARGMSPNPPSPGVPSGSGTTAGAGTLAGEATAGSTGPDFTSDYRKNFEQTYGSSADFESVRPAYEYGYRSAGDPRYQGKSWDQAENDIRSDYERRNPGSRWEQVKAAVRHGWEKLTGRR